LSSPSIRFRFNEIKFDHFEVLKTVTCSGAGAGGESEPPKVLICRKFGQNLKKLDKEVSTFFNNTNKIIFLC